MRKFSSMLLTLLLALFAASPSALRAQPYGWGMMGNGWSWFGALHMIGWLLIVVIVIAGLVWLVRGINQPQQFSKSTESTVRRSPGLDILEERYARGEIGRDEFLQKRRDLGEVETRTDKV